MLIGTESQYCIIQLRTAMKGVFQLHRFLIFLMLTFIFLSGCTGQSSEQANQDITISAAASLADAMNEIASDFHKQTGIKVHINLAASGSLEKQIEEGAPTDLFISASNNYVDRLIKLGLVDKKDVKPLLSNQLVLITNKSHQSITHLSDLPDINKLAIGTPEIVPAGLYAKESLTALHLWQKVKPKLVYTKDVRQVLSYVETGNADAGLVYRSDAKISSKVKIVSSLPTSSHQPIVYPCAIIKTSSANTAAIKMFHYLQSEKAGKVFRKYGFEPMKKD